MTKLFIALMAIAVMVLPSVASANLIVNPGFETGNTSGWTIGQNAWLAAVEGTTVHSGSYALGVTVVSNSGYDATTAIQNLAINAGNPLAGSVYVKTNSLTGANAYLEAIFKNSLGNEISGANLDSTNLNGTNDWTNLTISGNAPTGAASVDYRLVVFGPGGPSSTGNVYWDDAVATTTAVPEPTSLLLLGSGLVGMLGLRKRMAK